MENYNNMMNNDYNAMVYNANMQQQLPMTSIPREMQIPQNQPMHQQQQLPSQQSDIINLSYHQREIQMPHPNLPQQMGLFPTVPISHNHNHLLQQQQNPVSINAAEQQIPQNVNIQYSIDNVSVSVNLDVQNNNDNFESPIEKDSQLNSVDSDAIGPNNCELTPTDQEINCESTSQDDQTMHPESKSEDSNKKKEPEVDPNQCRVCKSAEQLIDIFAIEEEMRICDVIMKICSSVRIHERDFLPHMICLGCLGRLRTAYQFVKEVQATDKELRGKLKRSKSKVRKPSDGFVLIDCNEFSESEGDDLQNDDEEYKISEVEEEEESTESGTGSDDSRKPPKKRGQRRSRSKRMKQELFSTAKRLKRDIVFIEADNSSEEKTKKKEKCKECNKVFSNKNSLRLHRKNAHFRSGEDAPFKCHICGRGFKYSINLTSHMQIHKESYSCDECGRVFASKSDVKKHALNQHKCSLSYECNKCRRLYCSVKRYQKHRESCSDYGSARKKISKVKEDFSFTGRDLFKTVAPVTTTHWSDSFSD